MIVSMGQIIDEDVERLDVRNAYSVKDFILTGLKRITSDNLDVPPNMSNYYGEDEAERRLDLLRERGVSAQRIKLAITMIYRDHGTVVRKALETKESESYLSRLERELK